MQNYFLPPRIEFGEGAVQNLGEHVKAFKSKKPLLVSDAGVINAGLLAKAIDALETSGLPSATYADIEPNPTDVSITQGVEVYNSEACDSVIAVGGGSVMDAAKAIRLLTTHAPPLEPYYADVGGVERIRGDMPPLICVPTTAGTGSEVSQGAIITDTSFNTTDRWRKRAIVTPLNMSNIALLDPGITLGMPRALTAATGMDAITHGIEAYVATKYHPIAEGVALQALRMLSANIEKVYHDGGDVTARGEMLLGSCMAAFSFQKGLGAVHSLAHQLSTDAPIPHGVANAILLPPVMEFNFSHATEKYAEVARALGIDTSGMDNREAGHAAIEKIKAFNAELNMPTGLGDAGLDEKKIPKLGADAMLDHCHKFNPRVCTEADMVALFEVAF
ncbi:iron-containing alcohol dehydrogenase [Candidatus Poribacteria bacterium]|nr:iron-containing alcohol dehydrogenase [Candidatus Poribacteria bacterium]MYH81448.1 iron-containing alcohol dehydrogenase [Candidatus Poribacteria bacterium]MYK96455.1 iron-containing alcohol dehydrogenase [Candidatus Poribacteria bacterium]